MFAKAKPLTWVLNHDDEHPMAFENEGFAAEQIDALQAVFRQMFIDDA